MFKHRSVVHDQQLIADMDAKVSVDTDEICIPSGVVHLGQRQTIWNNWLTERLVPVGHDMGRVEQARFG